MARARAAHGHRALVLLAAAGALLAACATTPPARPHRTGAATTTLPPTTTTTRAATAQWTTYGGSPTRAADDTAEAPLAAAPSEAWVSPPLDGAVFGQPLVYGGAVLVATEADTVYALDAAHGSVLWSLHLGQPVAAAALPCGDISPTVGVTSTMVVDPATGLLYVSATLSPGSVSPSGGVVHDLVAVDLARHTEAWRRDLDQPGWDAAAQLQRAGLALDGDEVLVGFGGNYGDCGRYTGWLLGVPVTGTGPLATYRVPAAREGAIWAPPGPAVDAAGNVFVATGNGSAGPGQAFDHGNAVVELSPALVERQVFAPADWAADNTADADLGSTSPVLLADGRLFQVGKEATGFLLAPSSLGGVGAPAPSIGLCPSLGGSAAAGAELFVVCPDQGRVLEVTAGPSGLSRGWTWTSPTGRAGSPTVARGAIWSVDGPASVLYGIDPASGSTRWRLPLATGAPPHFAAVAAGEGLLVVAGSRAVEAFR